MKRYSIALAALIGLLPAGCHNGVNQQLLEREIRRQEDQIYALEDELDDYECQLESVQNENSALRKQISTGDRGALDSPGAPLLEMPGNPSAPPRRRDPMGGSSGPTIEPNVEIDPGEEFDPSAAGSTPASGASRASRIADQQVQRIVLNKQLTGGLSHTGRGGDQGILVVFEPRNKAGQMLQVPGDVSIAVLDPQKPGPQTRIARWDFTAEEAQSHFRQATLGRGYQFELPWPNEPPTNRKLQVFVRYVTPDGRKLLADMSINIAPPTDRQAKRWRGVPAGSRRTLGAERSSAPPYGGADSSRSGDSSTDGSPPTARFLDPPQIVPEDEGEGRARSSGVRGADSADGPDVDTSPQDREAIRKKRAEATSSRPTWSPFR